MLIVVSVFLAGFLQTICLLLGLNWLVAREKRRVADRLDALQREWFEHEEGQPHKAAQVLDAAGSVVGSAAARSIMASLNADVSHAARAANTASDVIQAQRNPIMGLLAGGKRGKGAALMRLAELMGPMLAGAGDHKSNGADGAEYTGRRHRE